MKHNLKCILYAQDSYHYQKIEQNPGNLQSGQGFQYDEPKKKKNPNILFPLQVFYNKKTLVRVLS